MPNAIEEKDINTQEKIKHIIEKIKEIGKIVSQDYLDTDKLVQKLEIISKSYSDIKSRFTGDKERVAKDISLFQVKIDSVYESIITAIKRLNGTTTTQQEDLIDVALSFLKVQDDVSYSFGYRNEIVGNIRKKKNELERIILSSGFWSSQLYLPSLNILSLMEKSILYDIGALEEYLTPRGAYVVFGGPYKDVGNWFLYKRHNKIGIIGADAFINGDKSAQDKIRNEFKEAKQKWLEKNKISQEELKILDSLYNQMKCLPHYLENSENVDAKYGIAKSYWDTGINVLEYLRNLKSREEWQAQGGIFAAPLCAIMTGTVPEHYKSMVELGRIVPKEMYDDYQNNIDYLFQASIKEFYSKLKDGHNLLKTVIENYYKYITNPEELDEATKAQFNKKDPKTYYEDIEQSITDLIIKASYCLNKMIWIKKGTQVYGINGIKDLEDLITTVIKNLEKLRILCGLEEDEASQNRVENLMELLEEAKLYDPKTFESVLVLFKKYLNGGGKPGLNVAATMESINLYLN